MNLIKKIVNHDNTIFFILNLKDYTKNVIIHSNGRKLKTKIFEPTLKYRYIRPLTNVGIFLIIRKK